MNAAQLTIVDEIAAYIENDRKLNQTRWAAWRVGVTTDPKEELAEHGGGKYCHIVKKAESAEDAEGIENYLLRQYALSGGSGKRSEKSVYVYAYRKLKQPHP